jgi:hypothetical protein
MAHHNRSNDLSVITDAPKALCAVPIQSKRNGIKNYEITHVQIVKAVLKCPVQGLFFLIGQRLF